MKKINTLLTALPLREDQKERLKQLLPDTEIIFRGFMKAEKEEVLKADVIFGNVEPEYIACAEKLKWVQLATAGSDNYAPVVPAGVLLTNATGSYGPAISEYMLAVLLSLLKRLPEYYENQKKGLWRYEGTVSAIENSVCLVVGMGDIGGSFARKMKALGAYTIGVRRRDMRKPEYVDELYGMDALNKLLPRADVVALSLPQSPETRGIMNAGRLSLMKKGSILINVGRGSAVDQTALADALNSGHLGGAALDVAVPEPLPPDDPIWKAKNILITPHVSGGWSLPSTLDRVMDIFLENLKAWQEDRPMRNLVDPESGYRRTME
ncbi:MAG: D-2-hydroxyacid dehydrogenase [Oscillospiraceae bacterium]|jgi:phosphoglycerate dehydrogenase-like enzyme